MRIVPYLLTLTINFFFGLQFSSHGAENVRMRSVGSQLSSNEPLIYDDVEKKVTAKGNAVLRSEELLLIADEIIWDQNRSSVMALGEVILTVRGLRMLCRELELDLLTGNYFAHDVKTGFYPWTMEAESMIRKSHEINTSNPSLVNREYGFGQFHPKLKFSTITLDQKKSILKSGFGTISSGKIPLGIMPPLTISTRQRESAWNLSATAGKKANLGWYLGKRISWQVEKITTKAEITNYFKRGTLLSPEFIYKTKDSQWLNAFLNLGWISDQGENLGLDRRNLPFSKQRFYADGAFLHNSNDSLRIASQVEYESDSEINRDFRLENFSNGQWNDHFVEVAYEKPWGGISSLQRWQMNEHEAMVERKPNIRLETSPFFFSPLSSYHSGIIEYSDLSSKNFFGNEVEKSTKLDFSLHSFRPIKLTEGTTLSPSFTARHQMYDLDDFNPHRTWIEWANEIRLHAYADYEFQNAIWEIDDIRHSMDFILNFSHLNLSSAKDSAQIPLLDYSEYRLNLEPITLIDVVESDFLLERKSFRMDWVHELTTKAPSGLKDLLHFRISQDLWAETDSEDNGTKSTFAKFVLSPARWLSLSGQIKANSNSAKEITVLTASLYDGKDNTYQISRIDYASFNSQWNLSASKILNYQQKLKFSVRYDTIARNIPYWHANYEFKSKNNLSYNFSISERKGTIKEDELTYGFTIGIFSF